MYYIMYIIIILYVMYIIVYYIPIPKCQYSFFLCFSLFWLLFRHAFQKTDSKT